MTDSPRGNKLVVQAAGTKMVPSPGDIVESQEPHSCPPAPASSQAPASLGSFSLASILPLSLGMENIEATQKMEKHLVHNHMACS